ncbi:MAG: hypothetical protein CSA66_00185, partial [Proteobacteria bacterium]
MSDSESNKPKLSTADLKARLGLKKKARAAPPAPKSKAAPVAPKTAAPDAAAAAVAPAAKPTDESVAEARRRAAEAMREAGPAVEDFSVVGQEDTPVPAALPGGPRVEYVSVGADATYPGRERKARLMVIALVVVVGGLGFALGGLFSGASLSNEIRDSYVREAKEKMGFFKSQSEVLERIKALKGRLASILEQVEAVQGDADKDPLVLEKTFEALVPELSSYVKDRVFIDPSAVMGETMYNGLLMAEVVDFAVRSRLLFDHVQGALAELTTYLKMAQPPAATTRVVMVEAGEREVEGLGKIPIGQAVWIQDTGKPAQVALTDPSGREVGRQWQQMVLPVGETEPIQVATKNVMSLDLKVIYDERAKAAKRT